MFFTSLLQDRQQSVVYKHAYDLICGALSKCPFFYTPDMCQSIAYNMVYDGETLMLNTDDLEQVECVNHLKHIVKTLCHDGFLYKIQTGGSKPASFVIDSIVTSDLSLKKSIYFEIRSDMTWSQTKEVFDMYCHFQICPDVGPVRLFMMCEDTQCLTVTNVDPSQQSWVPHTFRISHV